jgi:Pentapeptide repeats (9 copies)
VCCTRWHSCYTQLVWHNRNCNAVRLAGIIRFRNLPTRLRQWRAIIGFGCAIALGNLTGHKSAELAILSQRLQLQSGIGGQREFAEQQKSEEPKFSEQPEFTKSEFKQSKFNESKFHQFEFARFDFPDYEFTEFRFTEPEFTEHDLTQYELSQYHHKTAKSAAAQFWRKPASSGVLKVEMRSPCSRVQTFCSQHRQDRVDAGALPLRYLMPFNIATVYRIHEKRTQTQTRCLAHAVSQSLP